MPSTIDDKSLKPAKGFTESMTTSLKLAKGFPGEGPSLALQACEDACRIRMGCSRRPAISAPGRQDPEGDLGSLERVASPRDVIRARGLELVAQLGGEPDVIAGRQGRESSVAGAAAEDAGAVLEFLAVDDDPRTGDPGIDGPGAVVDDRELDDEVLDSSRRERRSGSRSSAAQSPVLFRRRVEAEPVVAWPGDTARMALGCPHGRARRAWARAASAAALISSSASSRCCRIVQRIGMNRRATMATRIIIERIENR